MVEVLTLPYNRGENYTAVQEKLVLIFIGHRMKVWVTLDLTGKGFVRFKTHSGITENDRCALESLIAGLIGVFGKE